MTMTLDRLTEIKQKNEELVLVRKLVAAKAEEMAKHTAYRKQILVCGGTGCTSSGSTMSCWGRGMRSTGGRQITRKPSSTATHRA